MQIGHPIVMIEGQLVLIVFTWATISFDGVANNIKLLLVVAQKSNIKLLPMLLQKFSG